MPSHLSRRSFARLAGLAGAGFLARPGLSAAVPLFDGRSLAGWTQIENNATSLRSEGILDTTAFVRKIAAGSGPTAVYLRSRLPDALLSDLAAYSPDRENAKAVVAALLKELNETIGGSPFYDQAHFAGVVLRPETSRLLARGPQGQELARLHKMLLEDAFPGELAKSVNQGWTVKDGVMASTGSGRGVIYTGSDYAHFRLLFTMRHVSGNPDHQACVLIFCTRPGADGKALDALGGIQFQPPNGGRWDYRPGKNNNGGTAFTLIKRPGFDPHEWSRVEILADSSKGVARMAVAQPVTAKAVEVLRFDDLAAGRPGPVAWQMHNAGLIDEFKDVSIEANPPDDQLLTVR